MIWVATFTIHLTLKQKKETIVKQHCLLFSDSEHLTHHTQSNQVHTYQADQKVWADPCGGEIMLQQQWIVGLLINMENH